MIKGFLYFAILFLAFISCKKQQPTLEITGVVWDKSSHAPMPGVTISLMKTFASSSNPSESDQVVTDQNGKYTFKIAREKFTSVKLQLTKEGCFTEESEISLSNLTVNNSNKFDFTMSYISYVTVKFVNRSQNPAYITITRDKGKIDCSLCCNIQKREYPSTLDDIEYTCATDANLPYRIFFQVGGMSSGFLEATAAPGDTAVILYEY